MPDDRLFDPGPREPRGTEVWSCRELRSGDYRPARILSWEERYGNSWHRWRCGMCMKTEGLAVVWSSGFERVLGDVVTVNYWQGDSETVQHEVLRCRNCGWQAADITAHDQRVTDRRAELGLPPDGECDCKVCRV